MDWIDDLLDNRCDLYQITIIEGLMQTSSVADEYRDIDFENVSVLKADEIIEHLYENDNPKDPREQYKRIFRYGN